jgi:signal transduction histidine kinase
MKSIKGRLLWAFLTVIATLSLASLVFIIINFNAVQQYKNISDVMIAEYRMAANAQTLIDAYNVYLQSAGTDATKSKDTLNQAEAEIKELTIFLDQNIQDTQSKSDYIGFKASVDKLITQINDSIKRFEQGSIKDYFSDYNEANKQYGFVRSNGTVLIFSQLKYATSIRDAINQTYLISFTLGVSALVVLILGCIIFVVRFSHKLTAPLIKLTVASEQVANDNTELAIDQNILQQPNELGSLAKSFSTMTVKLRDKIAQLNAAKENTEKEVVARTKELNDERIKLEASINSLSVGFIMLGRDHTIMTINHTAKQILCVSPTSPLATVANCSITYIENELKGVLNLRKFVDQCLTEKKSLLIKEIHFQNRYLKIFITPIVTLGVIGAVVLVDDITEAKIMERSKDEFFSIASHELRTPLTAIKGNASLIKDFYSDHIKDRNLSEMIEDIHESSNRLIGIVNDFLDMSRLEQGKMEFNKVVLNIPDLINSVIKEYQVTGSQKQVNLSFQQDYQNKTPMVYADPNKVKQVLINLIGNGLKFTSKGNITISTHVINNMLKVFVADTGRGISQTNQNLLFRKFQQANTSILTRDTTKGTGLGLYISKLITEGMGGSIKLESSVETKGTTFSFTIPLATPEQLTRKQTEISTVKIDTNTGLSQKASPSSSPIVTPSNSPKGHIDNSV